ncbi:MAG: NAD(+) synthase [Lachnospiraceae bacterium]|nr:NAD(+) synthase [Lachnospiraceae bacterium]
MHNGFLKVAAVTPDVRVADVAYNVEHIIRRIDEASLLGAKIIVFPELCITGYTCGDLFFQHTLLQAAEEGLIAVMRFLEKSGSDAVVFVGLPMEMDGKLYNVAAAIQSGKLLGLIPKQQIPDYAEHNEVRYFTRGNDAPVPVEIGGDVVPFGTRTIIDASATIPGLMIGCEICEDAWVPEGSHLALAKVGATVIVNLSASPEAAGKNEYRRDLIKSISARLIAGYIYTSAGQGESTTDEIFSAHRMIAENGVMLEESDTLCNGITISEIDIERLRNGRARMTGYECLSCADDTYHRAIISFAREETQLTRKIPAHVFLPEGEEELKKRTERVLEIQALGLKKRMEHTGCKKAVIGLSGGLDSTLALLVTLRTYRMLSYDPADILCISMPAEATSQRTKDNAQRLACACGVTFREIPIRDAVDAHLKDIGHAGDTHDTTYENAQARERTQILMDTANAEQALVVGTGDLSELALGWCTYNGDQMSMYGVNASVPKTLVRAIVTVCAKDAATRELREVLTDIADTPVSPELVPQSEGQMQKTEELIGPYELHDFFLYHMLRLSFTPEKIFRLAKSAFSGRNGAPHYDAATIKRWMLVFYRRFFAQQFKRSAMPDGAGTGSVSLSPRKGAKLPSDAAGRLWIEEAEALNV